MTLKRRNEDFCWTYLLFELEREIFPFIEHSEFKNMQGDPLEWIIPSLFYPIEHIIMNIE